MDENNLSNRLKKVAELVPENSRIADIGSDHAYLPAYLVNQEKIEFGVAGEVVEGPYLNAVKEIKNQMMENIVKVRFGDGLEVIEIDDRINTVIIAGMGGNLIKNILTEGYEKLNGSEKLILQPNIGEKKLRKWLMENNYSIDNETLLEEDGHYYEIIEANKVNKLVNYSDLELMFGPLLLKEKNTDFINKWSDKIKRNLTVLDNLKNAKNIPNKKINDIKSENEKIERIINDKI
ncbi:hypothetical protein GSH19_02285 [Lactobacillus sp. S2-2]|uniref:tRNA (adenine(22)-N(1))-methyltransferase n=1 Tax=Lactobacillus sp. S2-2 TaxID=2692917 RepID=UPI001F32B0B3|nr:class I SAM-dependent methyltransferase [Lactobacillus sp. S2-2]MCF6514992.1 hypothetical protein [Lactobacillus sp. S2-2]